MFFTRLGFQFYYTDPACPVWGLQGSPSTIFTDFHLEAQDAEHWTPQHTTKPGYHTFSFGGCTSKGEAGGSKGRNGEAECVSMHSLPALHPTPNPVAMPFPFIQGHIVHITLLLLWDLD